MHEKIAQVVNKLDVALYNHALQLFSKRLREIGISIDPDHVNNMIETAMLDQSTTNVTLCSYKWLHFRTLWFLIIPPYMHILIDKSEWPYMMINCMQ